MSVFLNFCTYVPGEFQMDFFKLLGLELVTGGELVEPPLLELQLFENRLGLFVTDERVKFFPTEMINI